MPGPEAAYTDESPGGDLYPATQEDHQRMLNWCLESLKEADRARNPHEQRWRRWYRQYRTYKERRAGDWRSKIAIPIGFYVIESVTPKLVAQLPKFVVAPIGPEDVEPARLMEELIGYSATRGGLYGDLVGAYRQALKYGTGILQTYYDRQQRKRQVTQPAFEEITQTVRDPEIDPATGEQLLDPDGSPLYAETQRSLGQSPRLGPDGQQVMETVEVEDTIYDGPRAEFVDISNFWPDPNATTIDDARYVIHRSFRDDRYVRDKLEDKTYRWPEWIAEDADFWGTDTAPQLERLEEIELGGGREPTRRQAVLHSFWTDDTCLVMLNERAIVRAFTSPYAHGEKPFVRLVDYWQEGEFWGVGELEPIEGLADGIDAIWNQRIDNVRLAMEKVFVGNPALLMDLRDLQFSPGGLIRTRGNVLPREAIDEFPMSDVTASAYTEAAELERMTEKTTAVSAYQTGTDSPTLNDTATGVALISEQGNTRFAFKAKLAEITGLVTVARHFGSLIQQFMPPELVIRRMGENGQYEFAKITQAGLAGALDYEIEAMSSTVTESLRKEQAMNRLGLAMQAVDPLSGQPIANVRQFFIDVLREDGIKDFDRYLTPTDPMALLQQLLGAGGGEQLEQSGEQASAPGQPAPGGPELALVGGQV